MNSQKTQNIIGPVVREFRERKGWSCADLARELEVIGWKVSEEQVEKIEAREAKVRDFETLYLLTALGVTQEEFWRRIAEQAPSRQRQAN